VPKQVKNSPPLAGVITRQLQRAGGGQYPDSTNYKSITYEAEPTQSVPQKMKTALIKNTVNSPFNGESLDWKTTFSDGSSETKYSWGAVSGNSTASSLPNGDYTASNPVYTNESGMSYKNGKSSWGFKVYLDPNWALCPNGRPRGSFRIHPDGNRATAPGTAGCIGLTDGEDVSRHVNKIFRDYMSNGRTMQLNVNDPTNINDECQDNGINDSGAPGE